MLTRLLLWIGVVVFGGCGALMAWTAAAFSWTLTSGAGGLGAVSASLGPLELLLWIAGIAVNRAVAARARAAGGLARRLHKIHLGLAFLFAAVAIGTLAGMALLGGVVLLGFIGAAVIFAIHLLVLAAALALLAWRPSLP
jgi:hypothetical protein